MGFKQSGRGKHRWACRSPASCPDGTRLLGPLCCLSCTFCCHSSWCWQDPPPGSAHASFLQQLTLTVVSESWDLACQFTVRPNLRLPALPPPQREGCAHVPGISSVPRLLSPPSHPYTSPFLPLLSLRTVLWAHLGLPHLPRRTGSVKAGSYSVHWVSFLTSATL